MGASARRAAPGDTPAAASGDRATSNVKGIRISEALFEAADAHARIAHRSVPKQIEYWSQLGRILERSLGSTDLHALLAGTRAIATVRLAASDVPDAAAVLAELEAERAAGTLAGSVTSAPVVYDLADDGTTLRRHGSDGAVALGTLVDGEFVERVDG